MRGWGESPSCPGDRCVPKLVSRFYDIITIHQRSIESGSFLTFSLNSDG